MAAKLQYLHRMEVMKFEVQAGRLFIVLVQHIFADRFPQGKDASQWQ